MISQKKLRGFFVSLALMVAILVFAGGCISTGNTTDGSANTDAGIRLITEEFPPFNYAGADGKPAGQAVDVVNGILYRLNQKADLEILPWNEGYTAAVAGPNVALFSAGRTDEREDLFKWVGPVASYDFVLYARTGSGIGISSLEAAKKAGMISVVKGDARHQFLEENNFSNILPCETDAECLRDLMTNKTDLWLGSSANSLAFAQREGIDPAAFTAVYPVRTTQLYIAFSKDTPDDVVTRWQDALDAMKRDGTFESIRQKYHTGPGTVTTVSSSPGDLANLALYAMIAETDNRLNSIFNTYEVLVVTPAVQSNDWTNIEPLLAVIERNEPNARTWYANPDGSYYTVVDGLTTANLMSRSYFPGVLAGNVSVGTVVVSHSTGKNTAIVAVPVVKNNAVTGVMGASVYLDTLTDTFRKEVPDGFIFYAIDRENKFALHSEKGQISRDISSISASSSFGKALQTILGQESGSTSYDDGGGQYRAKFRTSPLTGWRFVVAWPENA